MVVGGEYIRIWKEVFFVYFPTFFTGDWGKNHGKPQPG
jgi:hypothetical protein